MLLRGLKCFNILPCLALKLGIRIFDPFSLAQIIFIWLCMCDPREKGRIAKEGAGLPSQLERTLQLGW
jgi:hypothetical protein